MDVSSEFHERSYDDPFLHDSLFKKIYDRMDPNDPDRVIYEIGFDFSEKKKSLLGNGNRKVYGVWEDM